MQKLPASGAFAVSGIQNRFQPGILASYGCGDIPAVRDDTAPDYRQRILSFFEQLS